MQINQNPFAIYIIKIAVDFANYALICKQFWFTAK